MKKKPGNELVRCNNCGKKKQDFLYSIKKWEKPFKIVRCSCGLMFVNPRPSEEFMNQFYDDNYYRGRMAYRPSEKSDNGEQKQRFKRNVEMFISKQRKREKGRYLDVGCAMGHYVRIFQDMKWDATGIDVSQYSTQYAKDVWKVNVITGDVIKAGFPAKYYDIITMLDVIEHLLNPREVLVELERILKENGILVISTPNIGSFVAKIRKENWWGYKDEGHLHFFSLTSLQKMLATTGMEIFAIDCVYPCGDSLKDVLKRKENKGKRIIRCTEYILMTKVTPITFKCCRGITNLLATGITCFIRKKKKEERDDTI
jgi:2-polyprenyl-3-methyl-5-hydroxy-6-metoxy-1,4-benzoquinol methylase